MAACDGFEKLRDYLDRLSETENIPACDCIVYKGHEVVFRHMAGYSDVEKQKPVSSKVSGVGPVL